MTTYLLGVASGLVLAPVLLVAVCWVGNKTGPRLRAAYNPVLAMEGRDRKLARRA